MSGTVAGGIKAAEKNIERHGKDFFKTIGKIGGLAKNPRKGFGSNKERAIASGRLGGLAKKKKQGV